MHKTRWVRMIGDGSAFSGPCLLTHVIVWPHADTQYVDVYDGRDSGAGKLFCRFESFIQGTRIFNLGNGVPFDVGIYIDAEHADDETTVVFEPV